MTTTKSEIDELIDSLTENKKKIILYNDDFNTFENVITCLVKYCKHSLAQAEQCSLLVHYKGKCDVKQGSFDDLLPIYTALIDNKLNATIE